MAPHFGKEMTMTHDSSNTTQTEALEFTAAYGTAVAITGTRQPAIRNQQPAALRMRSTCERK